MKNEGWIYIGWDSKDKEYVKIGRGDTRVRGHCPQNPDYGIEFAIKVDNFNDVEKIIHNLFERKPFRKTKNKSEFCKTTLEKIFPLFLILANDVKIEDEKRGQTFIRIAEMVENNLEQYKKITKPFVVNKINKLLKEGGVPVEDFYVKEEMPKEKPKPINQPTPQNKVCKYETYDKSGRLCPKWNLFFKDHKKLVGKEVYPSSQPNNVAKLVKLNPPIKKDKIHNYGILYKGDQMTFNDFTTKTIKSGCNAYENIYFSDTNKTIKQFHNKTIKQTYEELKFK